MTETTMAVDTSAVAKKNNPVGKPVSGGVVVQERTAGPLTVSLRGEATLHLSGGHRYLDILWDALDGVAEQAESAEDRGVHRHQHIEYLSDDEYRSPESVPLVIVSDWPEAA